MGHVWQSYEMAGPGVLARARYLVVGSEGTLDCHAYGQLDLDRGGSHRTVYRADDFPGPGGAADMDGPTFRRRSATSSQGFADAIASGARRRSPRRTAGRPSPWCWQRRPPRRPARPPRSRSTSPRPRCRSGRAIARRGRSSHATSSRSASARRSATQPASSARLPHQMTGIASSTPDRQQPAAVPPRRPGDERGRQRQPHDERDGHRAGHRRGAGRRPQQLEPRPATGPAPGAAETSTMAAVVTPATASDRHSRRTANHSSPSPGVTLVSTGSAHVPANRNPATTAAASRIVMLPPHSSGKQSTIERPEQQRPRQPEQDRQQHDRPDHHEGRPRQRPEGRHRLEEGRGVEVGALVAHGTGHVGRVERHRPVGARVLAGAVAVRLEGLRGEPHGDHEGRREHQARARSRGGASARMRRSPPPTGAVDGMGPAVSRRASSDWPSSIGWPSRPL